MVLQNNWKISFGYRNKYFKTERGFEGYRRHLRSINAACEGFEKRDGKWLKQWEIQ